MYTARVFRNIFIITVILLSYSMLSAQVKIKERVEIKPAEKITLLSDTKSLSPRNIHVEFTTPTTGVPLRLGVYGGCEYEEKWVTGNNSLSLDFEYTGQTAVDFQVHVSAWYDEHQYEVPYHLRITDDTRVLNNYDGILRTQDVWDCWFHSKVYLSGLYADLKYRFYGSEICAGSQGLITFGPEYFQLCSTTYIPETELVTLSIIRGEHLGSFTLNGEIGSTITFPVQEEKQVWFIPVNPMPEGIIVDSVEIQIQAGVLTETKTIAVRACSRGTSFSFSAAKPKIYIRTQDALSIQPSMDENSTIVWDKNTDPVTFTITSGNEYGSFSVNGQNQEGSTITLQGDQLNALSFNACDVLPEDVTEGSVTIQATSKGIVKNVTIVVQSTSKLKLTLDVSPSSIEYGGYTTATAQTVNVDTQEPEAPPGDVTYNFALTQGSAYARFYEYDGGGGGSSASIAALSKISSTDQDNTRKLKRPRLLKISNSKDQNSKNQNIKYSIQSISKAAAADNGGPDMLNNVAQSDGNAYVWPEATDQEPVNPEGETVQVLVSASDGNIASASGEFLVKSSCIVVTASPSTIKQGEAAVITVQKRNVSGGLENLPADDYVEFEITGGANAGQLSSPDGSETGGYIGGTFQSAVFTAVVDPSLPDDIPVRISVYTDYCSGLGKLEVTTDNHPPIIERIIYNPSRRYFELDALVNINAEVTDPDGDSVTVTYSPGESFKITNVGPNIVTVIAEDTKGAKTEKIDTIYAVYISINPSMWDVKDGENIGYEVNIIPKNISASSIHWSWTAKDNPAGNSPYVNFTPDNRQQKVIVENAKWYAFPDLPCGARYESSYKFIVTTLLGEDAFVDSAQMVVFLPTSSGRVHRPYITGVPSMNWRTEENKTIYYIFGKNNLTRNIGKMEILISSNSQFYNKTLAHEKIHIAQEINGILKYLWTVDGLWKRIRDLKAPTVDGLRALLKIQYKEYDKQELIKWRNLENAREKEAYDVSDIIPPLYLYQNCNRYK